MFNWITWLPFKARLLGVWNTILLFFGLPRNHQTMKPPPLISNEHDKIATKLADSFHNDNSQASRFLPRLLSLGSTGFTFQISEFIVVKKVRPGRDIHLANERKVFAILKRHSPSPYVIQSFYDTGNAIFLEYLMGGDLASLLGEEQVREDGSRRVTSVVRLYVESCLCWMTQLSAAAAWLERLGLAHCDIRPGNILLCKSGQVKLADFDRSTKIGDDLLSGTEPFARLLGIEGGIDQGTYGKAGSRTEQFAIGSVFYSLTRGYEPFEDEWWGSNHGLIRMEKLQKMKFPPIGDLGYDSIILDCWHGRYDSVAEICSTLAALCGSSWEVTPEEDHSWTKMRIQECEMITQSGILDQLMTS